MILDARYWPVEGHDFGKMLDEGQGYLGATHFIAVGGDQSGPRERVECDPDGRIRRVHRLYDPVSWPGSATQAVFCSIVPAIAVNDVSFHNLHDLREQLLARGVLTRDLPYPSDLWDLARPPDVLALAERFIAHAQVDSERSGFHMPRPGVFARETCTIHESARLIAPVFVHPYARVEAERHGDRPCGDWVPRRHRRGRDRRQVGGGAGGNGGCRCQDPPAVSRAIGPGGYRAWDFPADKRRRPRHACGGGHGQVRTRQSTPHPKASAREPGRQADPRCCP